MHNFRDLVSDINKKKETSPSHFMHLKELLSYCEIPYSVFFLNFHSKGTQKTTILIEVFICLYEIEISRYEWNFKFPIKRLFILRNGSGSLKKYRTNETITNISNLRIVERKNTPKTTYFFLHFISTSKWSKIPFLRPVFSIKTYQIVPEVRRIIYVIKSHM